jgi:hypothetical protein
VTSSRKTQQTSIILLSATQAQPDLFAKPAEQSPSVQEPSLQEELNDSIPDFENENTENPKAAATPLPNPRRRDLKKKPPVKISTKATAKRRLTNLDVG